MGTWISHLRIAEILFERIPGLDEVAFTFGNLSPDSGIPNADWTEFDPPKEVTHFLRRGEGEHAIHDLVYYQEYLTDIHPRDNVKLYSFRLGYFFHLICDIMWARCIVPATKREFKHLYDHDPQRAVGIVKDDWYGLDQLYVRAHPESNFWRVLMPNLNPPSYLPFVNEKALHQQYEHIRKYYSEPEDQWFLNLPYQYLNEANMTRMVNDSVTAVLHVHEQTKQSNSYQGMQSSTQLLPELLLAPYASPLGN